MADTHHKWNGGTLHRGELSSRSEAMWNMFGMDRSPLHTFYMDMKMSDPCMFFSRHLCLRKTVQEKKNECIIPVTINASNPTICTEMTAHKTPSLNLRQRQLISRILSQHPKPGHSQQHLPYCSSICSTSITSAGKSVDTSDSSGGEEKRYAWRKAGQLYNAGLLDEQSRRG